jgi:hypothetical protein
VARHRSRIVFASERRSLNLWSMPFDADGAGVTGEPIAVTEGDNMVRFFHPSPPDGAAVVAEMQRAAETDIWMLAPGAHPQLLTGDTPGQAGWPRFSPDGRSIAYQRDDEIWIMARDGGQQHPLGIGVDLKDRHTVLRGRFAWLPDQSRILGLDRGDFMAFGLAGEPPRRLSDGLQALSFFDVSADGRWIVYQRLSERGVDVGALDVGDGSSRIVVDAPTQDYHPFLSPRGLWLYYQPDHKNIVRVPGPAQEWRKAAPEQVTHFPEIGLYLEEPQISADGRKLFFGRGQTVADLWLLESGAAGGEPAASGRKP